MNDFEANRDHLRAVAFRMLGSSGEAEDAVQEAWLRLSSRGTGNVLNPRAWLTTVVARVCLDMLRSRQARREVALDEPLRPGNAPDPEHEAELADSVGLAMLVVLDTLSPPERLAFVLHDMFAVPFADIAPILGRSVDATKMLASRARRRVRGAQAPPADPHRQRGLVEAFLAASREGDFEALVELLDPEVIVTADAFKGATLTGAQAVAEQALTFSRMTKDARVSVVGGRPAIVVTPRGRLATVMIFEFSFEISFEISGDRIAGIDIITEPARLAGLNLT
ncbi:MAG TPA: sigma-70 family RNA polymerase sigma factor [Candidatus Limnocylindrales bacterium]|nr:sigma-70 family RNA polymerase sigma factor [Candidatus Limnocylindrales bacterium]